MTDTKWINETAARYGKGGDPSIHRMMAVAIEAERERCAKIAELYVSDSPEAYSIASRIRTSP